MCTCNRGWIASTVDGQRGLGPFGNADFSVIVTMKVGTRNQNQDGGDGGTKDLVEPFIVVLVATFVESSPITWPQKDKEPLLNCTMNETLQLDSADVEVDMGCS